MLRLIKPEVDRTGRLGSPQTPPRLQTNSQFVGLAAAVEIGENGAALSIRVAQFDRLLYREQRQLLLLAALPATIGFIFEPRENAETCEQIRDLTEGRLF